MILFALFILFKLIKKRLWVRLDDNVTVLVEKLDRLRWLKQDEMLPQGEEHHLQDLMAPQGEPANGAEEVDRPRPRL